MKIISFEDKYRDDLIYMVLSAKNALGKVPRLNDDFLDIKKAFFDKGHPFWIALDEFDRVIGCIGTRNDEEGRIFLSRLYVKFDFKRHGIGSKLLELAENSARERGYKEIHVHLGADYLESQIFYPKHGYVEYKELYMKKEL
ncbi:MAG: GNAT family N-acetyltransferase [Clostridia bacterium]|nr:GNAT family N-acetyltransferase [Clostridia bacterium]